MTSLAICTCPSRRVFLYAGCLKITCGIPINAVQRCLEINNAVPAMLYMSQSESICQKHRFTRGDVTAALRMFGKFLPYNCIFYAAYKPKKRIGKV